MPRIFVSHSHQDRQFVETEIVAAFRGTGIDTWCSTHDIRSATHWEREILVGLRSCNWFLLIMSPESAASEWVKNEVNWAIEHRVGRIIPLIVRECQMDEFHLGLRRIQYIDFRGGAAEAIASMVATVTRESAKDELVKVASGEAGLTVRGLLAPLAPFHCGPWVPPEFFVGRNEELASAGQLIRSGQNFLVVGPPRAGKTSFCRKLMADILLTAGESQLVSYMNLEQGSRMSVEAFMEHTILCIVGEMAREVFECRYSDLLRRTPSEGNPSLSSDIQFERLVNIFRLVARSTHAKNRPGSGSLHMHDFVRFTTELLEISNERGRGRFVMFYDEANRLPQDISFELLNNIGEALSQTGVIGIYAASPEMASHFNRLSGLFGKRIDLGPFRTRAEMHRLLARYYYNTADRLDDLPVSEDAMAKLWEITSGRPYAIQLVAEVMFAIARQAAAARVELDHVNQAYNEAVRDRPEAFGRRS